MQCVWAVSKAPAPTRLAPHLDRLPRAPAARPARLLALALLLPLECRAHGRGGRGRGRRLGRGTRRAGGGALGRGRAVELQSDFDDDANLSEDDLELRVEAVHAAGAGSMTSVPWPPKKLITNMAELNPVKAETTVGRYTGSAPPFEEWPFFQSVKTCEELRLEESAEDLQSYAVIDFQGSDLTRALVLVNRWEKANLGRSAGFDRMGTGILSSFKFTNPILMRQLQGLNVLRSYCDKEGLGEAERSGAAPRITEQQLEEFLRAKDAEPNIAAEFGAVAPAGREVFVVGLVSSGGSALAIYDDLGQLHICLGHDCLLEDEGPLAEERLLRLVAGRMAALGVERLRCRARFTEQGKLVMPFGSRDFELAPGEKEFKQDTSDEEARINQDFSKPKDYNHVPEAVEGLRTWLLLLCLEDRIEAANDWCHEMGAAHLDEVIESREDLADFLTERDVITPGERKALIERDR